MNLTGGIWHNVFPARDANGDLYPFPLRDTGRKVPGWPPYRRRTLYEYTADPIRPMTFQDGELFIQPDKHFFTELASVPEFLQTVVAKDLHNPSSGLHDSICNQLENRKHGAWISHELCGEYEFTEVSSHQAAIWIGMGFHAAGFPKRATLVYRAVDRFGPHW